MTHRAYQPRRASKRWLQDAPEYILDVFDNKGKTCDRYTVLLGGSLFVDGVIAYLGMSGAPSYPQGFSQWGELKPHEAAAYRYRSGHDRIKWNDLPEHIRQHLIARVNETV
jgi:hypothetical protein